MNLSLEEQREIFIFLKKNNCCLRCCFRLIGCRSSEYYEKPEEFAIHLEYTNTETDDPLNELPCVACLGILDDDTQNTIIQKIQEKVQKEGYDCSTFTCAISIPICTWLRERLLQISCINELNLSQDVACTLKTKVQNIKDVLKWLVLPKVEKAIKKQADLTTPSPFLIELTFTYEKDKLECRTFGNRINQTDKQKRKYNENKVSRKNIEVFLSEITDQRFLQHFKPDVFKITERVSVEDVICSHSGIFIGGRYNKFSRQLCQTPWFVNGEKKMETSIQDILGNPIAEAVKAESIKFLSSGREDVDVRNIYSGRPFAIELLNPKMTCISNELLANLVSYINKCTDQVKIVSDLKILTRADLKLLKEGETTKTKYYRALCVCRNGSKDTVDLEKLNQLTRVKLLQKTPIRVVHRRPMSLRIRYIYEMRARWAKAEEVQKLRKTASETAKQFFVLDVKTQAGTYVKEFVHGDFGRTTPNVCELLGADIDIVALDVTGININWP